MIRVSDTEGISMKNKLLGGLLVAFFGSLQAADFYGDGRAITMPKDYWQGQKVTFQDAIDSAAVHALSVIDINGKQDCKTGHTVYHSLYSSLVSITNRLLKEPVSNKEQLIDFERGCEACLKKSDGYAGTRLAVIRERLVSFSDMEQTHFDWMQAHKTDPKTVAEIVGRLRQCYEDESKVGDLFDYLDERVKAVS